MLIKLEENVVVTSIIEFTSTETKFILVAITVAVVELPLLSRMEEDGEKAPIPV